MRLATLLEDGDRRVGLVDGDRVLPLALPDPALGSLRGIAAAGPDGLRRVHEWAAGRPGRSYRALEAARLGPVVPDPGAIYTIGLNYRDDDPADAAAEDPGRPPRPLVYGKLPGSVAAHGDVLAWDRSLTANVDAECELGVVIGAGGGVFGWTIVDDVSSRDPWLDGDQWLLGKSLPGFCPVGPWVVTADELDPADLRLGCTLNGEPIQDGRTSSMRFTIPEIVAHLGRHVPLRPGDLVATGTPARLATPPGPDRHLEPGDVVTAWIEGIGELTTRIR